MNPIHDIARWVAGLLQSSGSAVQSVSQGVPVSVWAGFADLGSATGVDLLKELKDAGADTIIFTPLNDASKRVWDWQPSRARILRGIDAAALLGFKVGVGPWARCDARFMDSAGAQVAGLLKDAEGAVSFVELDCEGSWETTARRGARRHPDGLTGAVNDAVDAFRQHVSDVPLTATVLYFRRPGGTALLKSVDADIRSVTVQAYSVWFNNNPATQADNFQPGVLQRRAFDNFKTFKAEHDIDELVMGLGWYSQDRSAAPAHLRLSKAEAFRRASEACLTLGCDRVSGWACHLFDGASAVERERRALVLREIRYLTTGGQSE